MAAQRGSAHRGLLLLVLIRRPGSCRCDWQTASGCAHTWDPIAHASLRAIAAKGRPAMVQRVARQLAWGQSLVQVAGPAPEPSVCARRCLSTACSTVLPLPMVAAMVIGTCHKSLQHTAPVLATSRWSGPVCSKTKLPAAPTCGCTSFIPHLLLPCCRHRCCRHPAAYPAAADTTVATASLACRPRVTCRSVPRPSARSRRQQQRSTGMGGTSSGGNSKVW